VLVLLPLLKSSFFPFVCKIAHKVTNGFHEIFGVGHGTKNPVHFGGGADHDFDSQSEPGMKSLQRGLRSPHASGCYC